MELGNLRTKNTDLEKEQRKAEALLGEQAQQIQQLKDQYALIKAQQGMFKHREFVCHLLKWHFYRKFIKFVFATLEPLVNTGDLGCV